MLWQQVVCWKIALSTVNGRSKPQLCCWDAGFAETFFLEADESIWVKQLLDIYVLHNDRYPSWLILTIVLKTLSCDLSGLDDLDRLLLQLRHRSAVQKPKCCSPAAVWRNHLRRPENIRATSSLISHMLRLALKFVAVALGHHKTRPGGDGRVGCEKPCRASRFEAIAEHLFKQHLIMISLWLEA